MDRAVDGYKTEHSAFLRSPGLPLELSSSFPGESSCESGSKVVPNLPIRGGAGLIVIPYLWLGNRCSFVSGKLPRLVERPCIESPDGELHLFAEIYALVVTQAAVSEKTLPGKADSRSLPT